MQLSRLIIAFFTNKQGLKPANTFRRKVVEWKFGVQTQAYAFFHNNATFQAKGAYISEMGGAFAASVKNNPKYLAG